LVLVVISHQPLMPCSRDPGYCVLSSSSEY
jgi:hypothetical protein